MKELVLRGGFVAWLDDTDFERANLYKWSAHKAGRTYYAIGKVDGKPIRLHRFILNAKPGVRIDHEDGNGLNCQKHNMRVATHQQNMANQRLRINNTSGFKGVAFHKKARKWMAYITHAGHRIHLGIFVDRIGAAQAYDVASRQLHGEFSRTNF